MGVEIKTPQISITEFFKLKSESSPADLIELSYVESNTPVTSKNFMSSEGNAAYRVQFFVKSTLATAAGLESLKFEFFANYPQVDSIPIPGASFTCPIQPPSKKNQVVGNLSVPSDSIHTVIASTAAPEFSGFSNSDKKFKIPAVEQKKPSIPFQSMSRTMERQQSTDPAKILNFGYQLSVPPKLLGFGTSMTNNAIPNEVKPANYQQVGTTKAAGVGLSEKKDKAVAATLGSQKSQLILGFVDQKGLSHELADSSLVEIKVVSDSVEYMRDFFMKKSYLAGLTKLYMRVSGQFKADTNIVSENVVYTIDHQTEVLDFIGTPAPPNFVVSENTATKITVLFKKTDPTLRRILIARIVKNPYFDNATVEKRAVLDFGKSETAVFTDDSPNYFPNTVIYRFVVENLDGSYGRFQSFLPKTFKLSSMPPLSYSVSTPISIRALSEGNNVNVSVLILTGEVCTLRLMREDKTSVGEFSRRVVTVPYSDTETFVNVKNQRITLNFTDKTASPGRVYRYFAMYRLGIDAYRSQEVASDEDEIFIKRRVAQRNPFNPNIVFKRMTANTNNNISLEFDLEIKQNNDDYDFFSRALSAAGVDSSFLQEFSKNSQKIKDIAGFLVERVDRRTGKRESFGMRSPGSFIDSPAERKKLKITEPVPGRDYEYVFKFCIRPAPTFLNDAYLNKVSTNDQPGNFTASLAIKYLNASFVTQGVLPSETTLREDTSIVDNMRTGQTGIELISKIITIPNAGPEIQIFNPIVKGTYTIITWRVFGNLSNVSYFMIYCEYEGKKNILGTIACVGEDATYKFEDKIYSSATGKKAYSVEIMTISNDSSLKSADVVTVKSYSSPVSVIGGYVIPPDLNVVKSVAQTGQNAGNTQDSLKGSAPLPSNYTDKKLSQKYGVGGIAIGTEANLPIFLPTLSPNALSPIANATGLTALPSSKFTQTNPSNPLPPKPKASDPTQFLGIAEGVKVLANNTNLKVLDLIKNSKSQRNNQVAEEPLALQKFTRDPRT